MRDLNGRGTVAAQHWTRKAVMSETALIVETRGSDTRLVLNRPQAMFEECPEIARHFLHMCAMAPDRLDVDWYQHHPTV